MIIQLPFVPNIEQARAVVKVLSRELPSYVQPGVQIYRGNLDTFKNVMSDSELAVLVRREIPDSFYKTVHAPFSALRPSKLTSLLYPESENTAYDNIRVAQEMGATSVILHPCTLFYTPQKGGEFAWRQELDEYDIAQRQVKTPFIERAKKIAELSDVRIAIENMPIPINGDTLERPEDNLYEPNMVTYEDIQQFCELSEGVDNLLVTFDAVHQKISQTTINRLLERGIRTPEDLRATYFRGVYPDRIDAQPDVSDVLSYLVTKRKIADFQLGDAAYREGSDYWLSESGELGKGLIGEKIWEMSRTLFEHDIPVSIDVAETDYVERKNQTSAIRELLKSLA